MNGSRAKKVVVALICGLASALLAADAPPPAYTSDFAKIEIGKTPEDYMILDGSFTVREFDGVHCLELAPDPVGSYGALFGPDSLTAMDVQARVWGQSAGKRVPEIGIGADDAGGYKLFLVPATHSLEIRKGDDPATSVPFTWTPGAWSWLRLRVAPKDNATWTIQGKAWRQGEKEPADWTISTTDTMAPSAGKASIWGNDYSEQPIRFDNLSVIAVGK